VAGLICRLLVRGTRPHVAHHDRCARQHGPLRILDGSLNAAADHLRACRTGEHHDDTDRERGIDCRGTDGMGHGFLSN